MEFNYRHVLKDQFRERGIKSPSYSLRAYARDLKVSSTALSDVMSGKRNFSRANVLKIAEKLNFSPEQLHTAMLQIKLNPIESSEHQQTFQIADDEFNMISHWYYLAILTLSEQKNVEASEALMAQRLGISRDQAKEAIKTLIRLKLIRKQGQKLKRTSLPLRTTTDVPSYAIRNYHKENLEVVRYNLENTPINLREISSMNLNIDPHKIKKAKKLINDFKEEFTREMEKTAAKKVYTLSMHFFPASMQKDGE